VHYPTRQFLTCLGWALLAFAIPGFTRADDRQILVAPGPDLEKVIAFLERIKAGYVVASGPLERLRVHGRVSRVIKSWSPDVREQTEKTMPAPDWLPFLLVERGLKRRYEQEYRVLGPKPSDEKVNVVMNPEGVFKLDDRRLFMLNLTHYQTDWSDVASGIYGASMVFDGVKYGPLDVVCDSLIQQLRGTGQLDWNSRHFTLQCKSENGLLCVERLDDVKLGKPRLPNSFSFIVDPKRGFRSIRFVRRWGGPGLNLDYEERREVEMNEVLPGVYFQRRGREFVKNLGPIPEKESTAGWRLPGSNVIKLGSATSTTTTNNLTRSLCRFQRAPTLKIEGSIRPCT
jgi:hypothetical protein